MFHVHKAPIFFGFVYHIVFNIILNSQIVLHKSELILPKMHQCRCNLPVTCCTVLFHTISVCVHGETFYLHSLCLTKGKKNELTKKYWNSELDVCSLSSKNTPFGHEMWSCSLWIWRENRSNQSTTGKKGRRVCGKVTPHSSSFCRSWTLSNFSFKTFVFLFLRHSIGLQVNSHKQIHPQSSVWLHTLPSSCTH